MYVYKINFNLLTVNVQFNNNFGNNSIMTNEITSEEG